MTKPRYIYVTDQGDVFSSADEPTREDLRFAAVGMLTIVRLTGLCYRGQLPKWRTIPPRRADLSLDTSQTLRISRVRSLIREQAR